MNEFKDQLDATEKDKVTKHITELLEIAAKGLAGDVTVTANAFQEKKWIRSTRHSRCLSLFQKVRWEHTPWLPHTILK
jgi:molecular chaperone DnaK